jgi:hypothetical protein
LRTIKNILTIILILCCCVCKATARKYPFKKTDKGPFGTYVLYDQLPVLFPDATVKTNYSSPQSFMSKTIYGTNAYFVVALYAGFPDKSLDALKDFVDKGNVLFISAYFLDEELEKWLGIKMNYNFSKIDRNESIGVWNTDSLQYDYFNIGHGAITFLSYDSLKSDYSVSGRNDKGRVTCLTIKRGSGFVVIHCEPYMFSNYHLIKKGTKAYSEILFSSLPGPVSTIYWDEYTKSSGEMGDAEPLRFIFTQPALRNAFLWAVAGLLLVVFLSFKRKQKAIPLITPLVNTSLDMVRTISDLYFFSRKNEVIAKKKIAHFTEYLKNRYNIFTGLPADDYWNAVQLRSGMKEEDIKTLRRMVELYKGGEYTVTDTELITLNQLIDNFYSTI